MSSLTAPPGTNECLLCIHWFVVHESRLQILKERKMLIPLPKSACRKTMNTVIEGFKTFPSFMQEAFKSHLIVLIICLAIFAIALVMSNKLAVICRYIYVIGAIGCGVYAVLAKKKELLFALILSLIVMIVIRLIIYSIRTIRQNRIDRRIEERALAKAAARRGSWKNRQGYSGHARVIEDDYVPEKMNRSEINDVIKHDMSDTPEAAQAMTAAREIDELEDAAPVKTADKAEPVKNAEVPKSTETDKNETLKDTKAARESAPAPEVVDPLSTLSPELQAQIAAQARSAARKLLAENPSLASKNLKSSLSKKKAAAAKKTYTIDDDPNPGKNEGDEVHSAKERIDRLIHTALGSDEDEEAFFNDEDEEL